MFVGLDCACLVNVTQDDAAKDRAQRVSVTRHHQDPDGGLKVGWISHLQFEFSIYNVEFPLSKTPFGSSYAASGPVTKSS